MFGTAGIGYIMVGQDKSGLGEDKLGCSQGTLMVQLGYSEDNQDTVRIQGSR
jgi:hypothetical protein